METGTSRIIHYIDGPSGSGKTRELQNKIISLVDIGERVVVCQPSKRLIDETVQSLRKLDDNIHIKIIHGDVTKKAVVKSIYDYLRTPYPEAHVLFTTFEAFDYLEFFSDAKNWHMFVDEPPQGHQAFERQLAKTHRLITTMLALGPEFKSIYRQLLPASHTCIRDIERNTSNDAGYELVRDLATTLMSNHWKTYVSADSYQGLLDGDPSTTQLSAFSVLQACIFENFKSVTITGAFFKESPLYVLWSAMGVDFREVEDIELRYRTHEHVKNLRIFWSLEADYSKTLRDKEDQRVLKAMRKAISAKFADTPFLWSANKDVPDNFFGRKLKATRLPQSPYGLNEFEGIDVVVFLSAHNPSPAHCKFLSDVTGADRDVIRTAIHGQQLYQAIMRRSLRDPANERERNVVVPDLGSAESLKRKLPNAELEHFPIDIGDMKLSQRRGRKPQYQSGAERTAASRASRKADLNRLVVDEGSKKITKTFELFCLDQEEMCNELSLYKSNNVTRFRGTIWEHIRSPVSVGNIEKENVDDFDEWLFALHLRKLKRKTDSHLISPSYFVPNMEKEKYRTEGTIQFINGIWLDNDEGGILPETFANLFPQTRMSIFNSFSATREKLKYRVYIPTNGFLNCHLYKAITKHIMKTVVEAGYLLRKPIPGDPRQAHGFDTGKNGPASLFYVPSQPGDPSGIYFKHFREEGRMPLDPQEWLEKVLAEEEAGHFIETPMEETWHSGLGACLRNGGFL